MLVPRPFRSAKSAAWLGRALGVVVAVAGVVFCAGCGGRTDNESTLGVADGEGGAPGVSIDGAAGDVAELGTGLPAGEAELDLDVPSLPSTHSGSSSALLTGGGSVTVVLSNLMGAPNTCDSLVAAAAGSSSEVANLLDVVVVIDSTPTPAQGGVALAPGTYALGNGLQASYRLADATCADAEQASAISGTAEIDRVEPSVDGWLDLTFPSGRIVASFNAPFCQASNVGTGSGGMVTCERYSRCGQGMQPCLETGAIVDQAPRAR